MPCPTPLHGLRCRSWAVCWGQVGCRALRWLYPLAFGTAQQLCISAACQKIPGASFQRAKVKGTMRSGQFKSLKMQGRQVIAVRTTGLADRDLVQKILSTAVSQVLTFSWVNQIFMYKKKEGSPLSYYFML